VFVINQFMAAVFTCETVFVYFIFMLPNPPFKIISNAYIQNVIIFISHKIYIGIITHINTFPTCEIAGQARNDLMSDPQ